MVVDGVVVDVGEPFVAGGVSYVAGTGPGKSPTQLRTQPAYGHALMAVSGRTNGGRLLVHTELGHMVPATDYYRPKETRGPLKPATVRRTLRDGAEFTVPWLSRPGPHTVMIMCDGAAAAWTIQVLVLPKTPNHAMVTGVELWVPPGSKPKQLAAVTFTGGAHGALRVTDLPETMAVRVFTWPLA